jgi:prepilin-type N-terminal cleavage/methylation domain-containing protein
MEVIDMTESSSLFQARGFSLAEVMCCVAISLVILTCVVQSTEAIYTMGGKIISGRQRVTDYASLAGEMSSFSFCGSYGSFTARVGNQGVVSGYEFANVEIASDMEYEPTSWEVRLWSLPGRR